MSQKSAGMNGGKGTPSGLSSPAAKDRKDSPLASPGRKGATNGDSDRAKSARPAGASRPESARGSSKKDAPSGRVRVVVRLRPRNSEEKVADADFADCVELQPEMQRVKLRKNNWETDTYQFDDVLGDTSSQKRVFEVVAKPVVESVLDGYNGTIMAYGQTGTGKTFTLGCLGENDVANTGIMLRAMEDVLAGTDRTTDTIMVSYLQLYLENVQDLLAPEKESIAIVEDPKTGDVSVPHASTVEVQEIEGFKEMLQKGEQNRSAANTKMNTESSRSHAILMVHIRRSVTSDSGDALIRKGKLLIVDLAGSERVQKSGAEGHLLEEAKAINLSLTALGKCINALAEGSPHVPIRDSKLTRLLKDSFGGSARTSMIITIGPSPRNRSETQSTIQFGQRAMKVENMLKLKEEFDYKSLSRKLQGELDAEMAERERTTRTLTEEREAMAQELAKAKKEVETAQDSLAAAQETLALQKARQGDELSDVRRHLDEENRARKSAESELEEWKAKCKQLAAEVEELKKRPKVEEGGEKKDGRDMSSLDATVRETIRGQKATIAKLFEQVGLPKILALLEADDVDVRVHAIKVLANLAAEEANQERIVAEGGLNSLLKLLTNNEDETIRRVAAGAIANLAMNEVNQELIMKAGGVMLLVKVAEMAEDPQTLRMVAGAIANLCGNDKVQQQLREEKGLKALLSMAKSEHLEVLAQVARGFANFAKCDKGGKSMIIEDGALPWIVAHANHPHSSIRRHIELALCHLAQHEVNAKDIIDAGALNELVRISKECAREDIRGLASKTLGNSPIFQAELKNV